MKNRVTFIAVLGVSLLIGGIVKEARAYYIWNTKTVHTTAKVTLSPSLLNRGAVLHWGKAKFTYNNFLAFNRLRDDAYPYYTAVQATIGKADMQGMVVVTGQARYSTVKDGKTVVVCHDIFGDELFTLAPNANSVLVNIETIDEGEATCRAYPY